MTAATYRLDENHQVIEVREVIDFDDAPAIEQELCLLIPCCAARNVIVDLRTPILTTATLHLLVRLRETADRHAVILCVIAREPQAARVLDLVGLRDFLRVTVSLPGARVMAAACGNSPAGQPSAGRPPAKRRPRTQVKARLYALIRADFPPHRAPPARRGR
jgi:anti-anti-sigma regulatory factor